MAAWEGHETGDPALICASCTGLEAVVNALPDRKDVDVNVDSAEDISALMWAADKGYEAIYVTLFLTSDDIGPCNSQ